MKPDKCQICALRIVFDQSSLEKALEIEGFIKTLRGLQNKNFIPKGYHRRIHASAGGGNDEKSEMCAVNSKHFSPQKRNKKCPSFLLNMNLTYSDAINIHLSKEAQKISWLMVVFATIAAIGPYWAILAWLWGISKQYSLWQLF